MNDLDYLSQNLEQFRTQYAEFVGCLPKLQEAFAKAFDVPKVTTEADYFVLVLSKLCVDRFEDVLLLCSQGKGDGAMPLVRAMFEGLVNASYIHAHPKKAENFRRYLLIFIKKVQGQIENLNGKTIDAADKKVVEDALSQYADAAGNIPGPKSDWTSANLVDRAKDVGLAHAVVPAYYRTIEIAHPSMIHVYSQSAEENGQRFVFGNSENFSKQKVSEAIRISHYLAIEVLKLLYETFANDDVRSYLAQCSGDYSNTWSASSEE